MRSKVLAGNWKMNLGPKEAVNYFSAIGPLLHPAKPGTSRVIFVPAYDLRPDIFESARSAGVELGAQNVHWAANGAFTGELSPKVLQELGVNWVLVGHSERRQFFGETNATAIQRLNAARDLGLNVVFCIGETLEQRDRGETFKVLDQQLQGFEAHPKVSVAYEPVWAIGTGRTATPEQAQEAHAHIRKSVGSTPILYGGSVTAENAATLTALPDVDGVLVGGASLKPDVFSKILSL